MSTFEPPIHVSRNMLFRNYFLPGILLVIVSCNQEKPKEIIPAIAEEKAVAFNPYQDSEITVEVFKIDSVEQSGSRGWGYDIMVNGNVFIHQPNVPALMGNNGFSSEENAREAGEFVIQKIRNNILPPSVSPEELDSLGVLD